MFCILFHFLVWLQNVFFPASTKHSNTFALEKQRLREPEGDPLIQVYFWILILKYWSGKKKFVQDTAALIVFSSSIRCI